MNNYKGTYDEYDDYLMHYGVKGMKWRHHLKRTLKTLKGKYYSGKSKLAELNAKRIRKKIGIRSAAIESNLYKDRKAPKGYSGFINVKDDHTTNGRYKSSTSGRAPSYFLPSQQARALSTGIEAGRRRAKKKGYKVK